LSKIRRVFLHYEAEGHPVGILHRFFVYDRRKVFEIAHERLVPALRLIGICIFSWFNWIYPLSFQALARLPLPRNPP